MVEKTNRRTVLKTVGASAATATGIHQIGEVRGTDYVKIPTVRGGKRNEAIETEEVPQEWFEHTKKNT